MTDDPNKKQNDPSQSGGQQRNYGQGQNNPNDPTKRPTQSGHDQDDDQQKQDQGGQRKAS